MNTSVQSDWMLYGAYGVTGRLILDEALHREHRPLLAGRDAGQLAQSSGARRACQYCRSHLTMQRHCARPCRVCVP